MNKAVKFKARTSVVNYGDGRKFFEWRIHICQGDQIVGMEEGPARETIDRATALKAARERIAVLKSRRLFPVKVSKRNISHGRARCGYTCAIAEALSAHQERMGFSKRDYLFEVSPYGAFVHPRGIVLVDRIMGAEKAIPADDLPIMVTDGARNPYPESMMEWAMQFDDWAESKEYASIKDWRQDKGHSDGDSPCRPCPAWFVFDLDLLQPIDGDKP